AIRLVHRDIKPSNIWLEAPKGKVRLLDFGLAFDQQQEQRLTTEGSTLGTPEYMAPEQVEGRTVDHRADLFSLGVVLYQLCTGQRPFARDLVRDTLMAVLVYDPPSVRSHRHDIPADLEGLVRRMIAKNPAQRPQSAAEVIDLLSGQPANP